jgi:hypothetical protein
MTTAKTAEALAATDWVASGCDGGTQLLPETHTQSATGFGVEQVGPAAVAVSVRRYVPDESSEGIVAVTASCPGVTVTFVSVTVPSRSVGGTEPRFAPEMLIDKPSDDTFALVITGPAATAVSEPNPRASAAARHTPARSFDTRTDDMNGFSEENCGGEPDEYSGGGANFRRKMLEKSRGACAVRARMMLKAHTGSSIRHHA